MTAIAARTFHWQSSVCQIWSVTRFYEGERDLKRIINKREQQGEKGLWRVEIWLLLFAPRWPLAYLPASSPTSFGSVGLLIDLVLYRVIACFICEKIWFAAWCARFFSKEGIFGITPPHDFRNPVGELQTALLSTVSYTHLTLPTIYSV